MLKLSLFGDTVKFEPLSRLGALMNKIDLISFSNSLIGAAGRSTDAAEFCQFLVFDTFALQGALAGGVFLFTSDGRIRLDQMSIVGAPLFAAQPMSISLEAELRRVVLAQQPAMTEFSSETQWQSDQTDSTHINYLFPGKVRGIPSAVFFVVIPRESIIQPGEFLKKYGSLVTSALNSMLDRIDLASIRGRAGSKNSSPDFAVLTNRQNEILDRLVQRMSNNEIAQGLRVSESLVKQELMAIFKVLGTSNRHETAALAKGRNPMAESTAEDIL